MRPEAILQNFAEAGPMLIIVDEAQNLTLELLEEIRLLGNLESASGKAVQVILAAQPEIEAILKLPRMAGFRQLVGACPP